MLKVPIHKEQVCYRCVTDLQRKDLLQAYRRSVFETVTELLQVCYLSATCLLQSSWKSVMSMPPTGF